MALIFPSEVPIDTWSFAVPPSPEFRVQMTYTGHDTELRLNKICAVITERSKRAILKY